MPSSSLAADATLEGKSLFANSPSSFAERSATSCSTRAVSSASGDCLFDSIASPLSRREPGHAVGAHGSRELPCIVQIVQVRDRLAHGEENLDVVQRAPGQKFHHL